MKKNYIIWIAVLIAMAVFCISASMAEENIKEGSFGADFLWSLDENGTIRISGTGEMYWKGNPPWEECKDEIISVVIEEGITLIGPSAFFLCDGIQDISLPSSLEIIENWAFAYCTSLTEVQLPFGLSTLNTGAFCGCSSLNEIIIPGGVEFIEETVFYDSGLSQVKIENGVQNIGAEAFAGCDALKSIVIPGSVQSIDDTAFDNCPYLIVCVEKDSYAQKWCEGKEISVEFEEDRYIASGVCGEKLTWMLDKEYTLTILGTGEMTEYEWNSWPWFDMRTDIKKIVIGHGVTNISSRVFHNMRAMTSISIPNTVVEIGEFSFGSCTKITEIELPDSLIRIDSNAFQNCSALKSVCIPDSVNKIGDGSFSSCIRLESISLPDTLASIGNHAFAYCQQLEEINLPSSLRVISNGLFEGCRSLKAVNISDMVEKIGEYAFMDCRVLTSIFIPATVREIGTGVFDDCEDIVVNVIRNSTAYNYCIEKMIQYEEQTLHASADAWILPDHLKEIREGAFEGVEVKEIIIPDGCEVIGKRAFANCGYPFYIFIPESVKSIEENAFDGCESVLFICNEDSEAAAYAREKEIACVFN